MAFPPEAFIIGAQKAGTTSLADLLDQHPGIVVSNPKEPDFFNVNFARGVDWYRTRFRHDDGVLLDASVGYSMAPNEAWTRGEAEEVPRRIHALSPKAKFIYVVRDPAERCYSAYWHEVRARGEKRGLRQAVEDRAYYTMASYYFQQIDRFLPYFPLERFLILEFSQLMRDPATVARMCVAFLGAGDPGFSFSREQPKNQGFRYNGAGETLRSILGNTLFDRISRAGSQMLPPSARSFAKKMIARDLPRLGDDDRAWLYRAFAADMAAFERLTGIRTVADSKRNLLGGGAPVAHAAGAG
jgi:hypothetical protein